MGATGAGLREAARSRAWPARGGEGAAGAWRSGPVEVGKGAAMDEMLGERDWEGIKEGDYVHSVVGILEDEVDPMVSVIKVENAPLESFDDIGGLDAQIQEIKVAVELPLTHPELYEDIGIRPQKGVILYGEPGTGKTLLALVCIF
ncbi:hypothetical protein ACQ4PT_072073 [Festuca glaucescens]